MPMLQDAVDAIRMGDREQGRQILEEILETDESNEEVWLWLSSVVESDEDREICLENVLALNPDNVVAQKGLEALRSGTFNVHDIMSEAIEEEEEEETFSEATFLDEFTRADEAEAEDEFEFPGAKAKRRKKAATGGLNIRLILLLALVLCVVLALGGAAVYNFLSGDEDGDAEPSQEQPTQEVPAIESDEPEATPTETPTVTPTPTATNTPFHLPTAKPTEPPTPTATPVVSPTP